MTRDSILRLARDLCLGIGAFFVTPAGTVSEEITDVMRPEDAEQRVAALARSCLAHPSARGTDLFLSAEPEEERDGTDGDYTLGCAVVPVRSDHEWIGLLGVVDVWLPELDEEQRAGLLALARQLAEHEESERESRRESQGDAADRREGRPPALGPAAEMPSELFLGEVLDNLPDGLVVTRTDGTIVLVNGTLSDLTGLDADSVLGEDVAAVLRPRSAAPGTWSAATGGEPDVEALRQVLGAPEPGTGVSLVDDTEGYTTFDAAGRRIESRFAGDCFVTLIRQGSPPHEQWGAGVQGFLDQIEDGIVCCDATGTVVLANRAARRLQGLGPDELAVGDPLPEFVHLRTAEGHPLGEDDHPLVRSMRQGVAVTEDLILEKDGALDHVAVSARPLRTDHGEGSIAVLRDVTAERERQRHLTHAALHDPLTGVANRYLLNDALDRMLDGLVRRGGTVSLAYLDLDDFKAINDAHGHDIGDEVLRAVARRLERSVRGEDVVARLGGDEFIVAHVSADGLPDGDLVVARVRKVLSAPYRFGGLVLDVRASVGYVSTSSGGDSPEALVARADRAMYEQKRRRGRTGALSEP